MALRNTSRLFSTIKSKITPKVLVKPVEPDPYECCGDGCKICVWDVYYEEKRKYDTQIAKDTPTSWGESTINME